MISRVAKKKPGLAGVNKPGIGGTEVGPEDRFLSARRNHQFIERTHIINRKASR